MEIIWVCYVENIKNLTVHYIGTPQSKGNYMLYGSWQYLRYPYVTENIRI